MEWKIGEIKQVNGEWYQCIEGTGCYKCDFNIDESTCIADNPHCTCRSDKKDVVFKKLEKVGEPITVNGKKVQLLKTIIANCDNCDFYKDINCDFTCYPRKCYGGEEGTYVEINEDMEENKLNLKPFDIQKAREGKPVCTRDGHKARIICFDYNGETGDYPIVALVHYNKGSKCYERVLKYTSDGLFNKYGDCQHNDDLMMLSEKKEGWAKIRKDINLYDTKEEADRKMIGNDEYVTAKVCWEE